MSSHGSLLSNVDFIVPQKFDISFGIALVALEGVGIIIPVHDITENKEEYPKIIAAVIFTIATIYVAFG